MRWEPLLTPLERDLYPYIATALLKGGLPYLLIQLMACAWTTLLLWYAIPSKVHLILWVVLLLIVISLGYITTHIKKQFDPAEFFNSTQTQERAHLTMYLFSMTTGVLWWFGYLWVALYYNAPHIDALILMIGVVRTFLIALLGGFRRIFVFFTLSMLIIQCTTVMIFLGNAQPELFIEILLIHLFHLAFLLTQNHSFMDTLHLTRDNNRLCAALTTKNHKLEQANLAQSRYLSAASHDLRQPLHALTLLASTAHQNNTDPSLEKPLRTMEQAVHSVGKSFDAILNLSRINSGVVQPVCVDFPIQTILERLNAEYQPVAHAKGLRFHVLSSSTWTHADDGIVYRILSNFVSNAIRYTTKGGVTIGVRRVCAAQLDLCVYDTGIGIPKEQLDIVFSEFKRLKNSDQYAEDGLGLGLFISKKMADLLSAKLFVESTINKGSVFKLRLQQLPNQSPVLSNSVSSNVDCLHNLHVAVIDDDLIARAELGKLLKSWGMRVDLALTSKELQRHIQKHGAFDLIVSDHHLGDNRESGLEILTKSRALQAKNPPTCVLMTGDTSLDIYRLAQSSDIKILHKPIHPTQLHPILNIMMQNAEHLRHPANHNVVSKGGT